MYILLTILLSFYPAILIYTSIPPAWTKNADKLVLFIAFASIFALCHLVMRKFISVGYMRGPRGGVLGIVLMTVFTAALAVITFYNILPGNEVYAAPAFLNMYVLKNPWAWVAFIAPFGWLFFE